MVGWMSLIVQVTFSVCHTGLKVKQVNLDNHVYTALLTALLKIINLIYAA